MDENEFDDELIDIRVQVRRDTYPELYNLLINIKKNKRSEKIKQLANHKIIGLHVSYINNTDEINIKNNNNKNEHHEKSGNINPNLKYDLGEGALDNFI